MASKTRHTNRLTAVAVGVFFFVNGATYASWVPRLPEIRRSLEISDTVLGLTLVGAGVGGLAMSLLSGVLVDRIGSRAATIITSLALSAMLPLIAIAPTPGVLFAILVAIGGLDGLTDVAMNSQALQLQRRVRQSLVNRMHATWSIGTLIGGLVASRAAAVGVTFTTQLLVTAAVLVGATLVAAPRLLAPEPLPEPEPDVHGRTLRPSRLMLLGLFGVGALAVLAELPATEWAALLMIERFDLTVGAAGFGFVGFAAGMVIGRLTGDRWADLFGPERVRRASAALAAVGLLIACTGVVPWITVGGLAVAGLGASVLFPLSIRRAGDLVVGSTGVAMFSSGARFGILVGPPVMGALSDATSRSVALFVVGGLAASASSMIRLPRPTTGASGAAGAVPSPGVRPPTVTPPT